MLKHAFKEWAVICQALAEGKQALLLRKGGIAEFGGDFQVEHTRFWLYPTWTHQQPGGLREEALPLLAQADAERPPAGIVRLTHFAEVTGAYHVHNLTAALLLAHLHYWSEETVRKRFAYRQPGLFVLPVRVYRSAQVFDLPDTACYQGCRSWVELERALPTDGATPVLTDAPMEELQRSLDLLLNPTALA
ncbi:MAG: DUF1802 family protein [Gemmataceae bacterium]|nr:DUF1802 family protein [Gemmataceae bacterium]